MDSSINQVSNEIPEFESYLKHPLFLNALKMIDVGAELIKADPNVVVRLKRPKRIIVVSVPVRMDNQMIKVFPGYRVQYNSILGPFKGGIRYHPSVTLGEVVGLACLMMLKNSVLGLPYGGAKGGVPVDSTQLSRQEKQSLTRRFTSEIGPFIGPSKDIPAPDVGTDSQVMAWMMDTYSQEMGYAQPGVVTGKPIEIGGSVGRQSSTGYGVVYISERLLSRLGESLANKTVAIQGFGNVGSYAAQKAVEMGAKIVAVSDVNGGIYNSQGLPIDRVLSYVHEHKTVVGFPEAEPITNEQLLGLKVDILMPCAIENVIHSGNWSSVQARIIVEGANGPVTWEASQRLSEKGVIIVPDIIANGGGVVVSYFEWVQDIMSFFWDEEDVNRKLRQVLFNAFDSVWDLAQKLQVDLRSAAVAQAVKRLEKASLLRGLYPR